MNLRVLIPVRSFEDGKQRLSSRLSPLQRQVLNARLCRHLFGVVLAVVPARHCIVVSRSQEVLELARRQGMQALLEDAPGGLNPALEQAAALAAAQGADAVLSLSCDLPLLQADDLHALIARIAPRRVTLGSDHTCTGTNALLVSPPGAIAYRYGPDSRALHREAACAAGLAFEAIHRPGIATDVDTPADLDALGAQSGAWTAETDGAAPAPALPSLRVRGLVSCVGT
ncbi:2-phospho-L-lactate guanylyltransferase [Luteimonas saliphila]|uniref:2-phospho-L-lactate guanylyltransferase n=1 Tax=Luteimonas saliphila TaxID=2804919 RepID=UPI00192E08AF|nr:2-phospho-L-lactate guanylyltransferase [Luteimonas saliphila]